MKRGKNDLPGYGMYPPYLVDGDSFFLFFGGGEFPPNFAKISLNNWEGANNIIITFYITDMIN